MKKKLHILLLLTSSTAGGLSLSNCKYFEQEEFGFACVELSKNMGVEDDRFAGTKKVKIKFSYESCLYDYYEKKHPEQRADGPVDAGGMVFTEWKERLCSEEVELRVECEVDSIEQTINTGDMLSSMTVTYTIPDALAIAGHRFLWGPGPLPETAECAAGLSPFVKLNDLTDIQGLDSDGNRLWSLKSFGSTQRAIIQSAGTGCLQVDITPN